MRTWSWPLCGPDAKENQQASAAVEAAASGVGNVIRHGAHPMAGPNALNHYQAIVPPPAGHCFYADRQQEGQVIAMKFFTRSYSSP